jgi:hypothetical protein
MRLPFETVVDPLAETETLRARRFGVIEMVDGKLQSIRLRPWPKGSSMVEARWWGQWQHKHRRGDRCLLYYNQPWGSPNYLALQYVVSTRDCRWATFVAALAVLDEIAQIKQSDAIVCDACNQRFSDRMMDRWGWQPLGSGLRRTFIKRFYGQYPATNWIT